MKYQTLVPTALIAIALVLTCILLYKTLLERKGQQKPKPGVEGVPANPPSGDHIFKNVRLNHENINVTIEEIRVLENGVFVIVSKNRSGDIVGSEDDEVWTQYKREGHRKELIQKTMRNPLAMTRLHTFVLAKKMAEIGCNMWVQGVVVFTHPNVELNVKLKPNSNTAVVTGDRLEGYINDYQSRTYIDIQQIKSIREWLHNLQTENEMHSSSVNEFSTASTLTEVYEMTRTLALEFGYEASGKSQDEGSFTICKNHEVIASVSLKPNDYSINTYKAHEPGVQKLLVTWVKITAGVSPSEFTNLLAHFIDQDAEDRLEPQVIEYENTTITYYGSMRYGVLKLSVSKQLAVKSSQDKG